MINAEIKDTYIYESPDGGKTVYRRKFGQNPLDRELVTKDSITGEPLHSEYYYDYNRNDLDRPNPFVKRWVLPVQQEAIDGGGEYYINFPQDLLDEMNLKEGDVMEWIDKGDGSYLVRKV